MKKNVFVSFLISLFIIPFVSCSSDTDDLLPIDEKWKADNEAKMLEVANDPNFTRLKDLTEGGYIYYRVIEEGPEGPELIKYGERARVEYEGKTIDGEIFDSQLLKDREITDYFIAAYSGGSTGIYVPIPGWVTILQHMKEGDEWEVWIPQELAYGRRGQTDSNGNVIMAPYSALNFTIKVLEVVRTK